MSLKHFVTLKIAVRTRGTDFLFFDRTGLIEANTFVIVRKNSSIHYLLLTLPKTVIV